MLNNLGLQSRYVEIDASPTTISIVFSPSRELTLGSFRREKQARLLVANLIRRAEPLNLLSDGATVQAIFHINARGELPSLLASISASLNALSKEKLYPSEVEEILQITAQERIRWTKSGLLPTSGKGSFGRGRRSIHFALYPAARIAELSHQPDVVKAWRQRDAKQLAAMTSDNPSTG